MRIKISSGDPDEEHVFTGYDFVFKSAYYPSTTVAYAMAVDQNDS